MIAVIRLRGKVNVRREIRDTLNLLGLRKKHSCVILPEDKTFLGMIKKVKDYVTYGEINEETLKKLVEKRLKKRPKALEGKSAEEITKEVLKKGIKLTFSLHPPRKGLKSIKKHYKQGGDLGYRGEKINELIERML